jgi:hypothetical protein
VHLTSDVDEILPVGSGGTNKGSYTAGSVIFAGAGGTQLTEDNANFFWDDSNNRLGLATVAPTVRLDVSVDGITNLLTGGLRLANLTAATAGATLQYSPALFFSGTVWDTTPGASVTTRWAFQGRSISSGTPTTDLTISSDEGGGSFTDRFFFRSSGLFAIAGITAGSPALRAAAAELQARLADDSAFADFECQNLSINAGTGNVGFGKFTPTRSAEVNLDANVTLTEGQFLRVGNTVTMSGRFTADPTVAATATSFEMTLPIASNIGAVEDLAGVAFCGSIAGQGAEITGSVANNTAVVSWVSGDITSQTWSYTFTYEVI